MANNKRTQGTWIAQHFINESSIYNIDKKVGIAKMPYNIFPYSEEEVQANAAYIVKAVNSHDELVEALKGLCDKLDNLSLWDKTDSTYYKAKAALSKATE